MFLDLLVGKAMNIACKKICTPEPKLSAKHTFKIEDFQLKVKAFLNSSIDVSCEFEEYSSFFFFFGLWIQYYTVRPLSSITTALR